MAANGSEAVRQLSQVELMGHLCRRAGFGATCDELEAALAKGYEATLQELLHPEQAPDLEEDLLFRSFPDFHETRKVDVAVAAWVWRMIHTQRPLSQKNLPPKASLPSPTMGEGRQPLSQYGLALKLVPMPVGERIQVRGTAAHDSMSSAKFNSRA